MKITIDGPDGICDPETLKKVILAMAPSARVIVWKSPEEILPPILAMTKKETAINRDAQKIANVVMAAPAPRWRGMYLLYLLIGGDTWELTKGELEYGPRPEAIAFSRYMKKVLPEVFKGYDKPAERLAIHQRIYFPDGGYKGTRYIPTALGEAVYTQLKSKGWPNSNVAVAGQGLAS